MLWCCNLATTLGVFFADTCIGFACGWVFFTDTSIGATYGWGCIWVCLSYDCYFLLPIVCGLCVGYL